jgi:hypothetical protein
MERIFFRIAERTANYDKRVVFKHVECHFLQEEILPRGQQEGLKPIARWKVHTETTETAVAYRSRHSLEIISPRANDMSPLAVCAYLQTLDLSCVIGESLSALPSCWTLHTLTQYEPDVSDVYAFASCQSLDLSYTGVDDVSTLASCQSLHTEPSRYWS